MKMITKELLEGIQGMVLERKRLIKSLTELEARIYTVGSLNYSGAGGGSGRKSGSKQERRYDATHELVDYYRERIAQIDRAELAVNKALECLDQQAGLIIALRYIDGLTWEEVAARAYCSRSTAIRMAEEAEKEILERNETK